MPKIYQKGSHTKYDVKIHIVWITKYLDIDHIHLLISLPTTIAIAKLVKDLKGYSSHEVQQQFPELQKRYWGKHFWSRGYFCASTGNVSEEMIKNYIENHDIEKDFEDDNFTITNQHQK